MCDFLERFSDISFASGRLLEHADSISSALSSINAVAIQLTELRDQLVMLIGGTFVRFYALGTL